MLEATGAEEDGVFRRDTYSGLNWSTVPSILVEMGFMTNEREDKLLNDPEYQQKLIDGMGEGIAACFGRTLEAESVGSVGVAPSDPLGDNEGE
jgi:N-acetylmuramoyl-L-alanine amidase